MRTVRSILAVALLAACAPAFATVNVFACLPEWAALANELGGSKVSVYQASTALQDPHRIEARPSLVARMRSADLAICSAEHVDALECRMDRGAIGRLRATQRTDDRRTSHCHDLLDGDREAPVDLLGLRHVGDAPGGGADRFAEDADRSGAWRHEAGDAFQEGRLPPTVRPEDRGERTSRDGEVHVVDRNALAVACTETANLDRRRHRIAPRIAAAFARIAPR